MPSRRHFLQSSAASVCAATSGTLAISPSFNHLLAASTESHSRPPHRFVFIRKSNGNVPKYCSLPSLSPRERKMDDEKVPFEVDLNHHDLPSWLQKLEKHKQHLTILHGISMSVSGGGHYSFSGCMGAYRAGRNTLSGIKRATVDFELARLFPSPFGHVEMSLGSGTGTVMFRTGIVGGFSAPAAHTRNYCYADPMTAYNELFKSVTNTDAVNADNSLLEYLRDQERNRLKGLDGRERQKVRGHVDSIDAIRARNQQVSALTNTIQQHLPKLDPVHADGGRNATLPEKQAAFTDVIAAALITGLTNVVTYTIDDLNTPITTLPENKSKIDLHRLGHNAGSGQQLRDAVKSHHMNQVESLVNKLQSVPEGTGTMFDNTTIIYMPETGAGHHGPDTEAPMVILTGENSKLDLAGRYIRLPYHGTEGHQTLSNWYTTLLNSHGNPIEHYGDLDVEMTRKKLPQQGAIARFIRSPQQ